MKKSIWFVLSLVLVLALAGCVKVPADLQDDIVTDPSVSEDLITVERVKGDDGGYYDARIDNRVFSLEGRVVGGLANHTEVNATMSGTTIDGYGSMSGRMWQSGKGILPVEVISLTPEFPGIRVGDRILIKTTDLKIMALPDGTKTIFICNRDTEVVAPPSGLESHFTKERITYELDQCRMQSPVFDQNELIIIPEAEQPETE